MPTDSLIAVFFFAFIVGFAAVISPGPIMTSIVTQSPRRGWIVGPLISTGHAFTELVVVVLIGFGLAVILNQPLVHFLIALVGGLLLLFMGVSMLVSAWRQQSNLPGFAPNAKNLNSRQLVLLGVITTLGNPFWYAWWITVAAGYLVQAQALGIGAIAAFYLGHISADYAWNTGVAALIGSGKRWITDNVYRAIIALCGVFFVYLGVLFVIQSFRV
jgi:threonine/homoserine/homoserine lactone efflux protein